MKRIRIEKPKAHASLRGVNGQFPSPAIQPTAATRRSRRLARELAVLLAKIDDLLAETGKEV